MATNGFSSQVIKYLKFSYATVINAKQEISQIKQNDKFEKGKTSLCYSTLKT